MRMTVMRINDNDDVDDDDMENLLFELFEFLNLHQRSSLSDF